MPETPIKTPCIKICVVDPASSLCIGCGRSLQEIGGWISMSPARRSAIIAALPGRLRALRARGIDVVPD
ncbi:DUF1289 domain-containing protein [Aquabacter spiritensis]|uniref:Fe-S protein YdhL (DUF1289 family) n=1 Tax=Aquabacter spiritensis TaxID=933073 RepID=A0A4R3LWS5_9HYPH|nr:DUF1289 domain-containing protein [Aquabacter spiritensis]TCT04596.1 hypothetical protein EDC64_10625 [Aquabacter spiritensis]